MMDLLNHDSVVYAIMSGRPGLAKQPLFQKEENHVIVPKEKKKRRGGGGGKTKQTHSHETPYVSCLVLNSIDR